MPNAMIGLPRRKMTRRTFLWIVASALLMSGLASAHAGGEEEENIALELPGDIKLGALFPIHKQGDGSTGAGQCGEIQKEDGVQPLEAMLFTLDEINRNPDLLPGIRLGVRALDSCDSPYHAAKQSLHLMQGFVSRHMNLSCGDGNGGASGGDEWPCGENIVGLVGPQTSPVSMQIGNLGRLFEVPQVSYMATSVSLCNHAEFPYFFRTVPSDVHQAKAIVELLKTFNWSYASIVHSDSDYGITGYQSLERHINENNHICLADPITIYNAHFKDEDYRDVINKLLTNEMSRVVIVFADRVPAGKLLEAAKTLEVKDKFIWVGSDAWASRESVVEDREEIVEGAIAVQPLRRELPGYNEYFSQLVATPNKRNPWFAEYLEIYHNCSNQANVGSCINNSNGSEFFELPQQLYIHFVRDAVYAFAHAIHNLHRDTCEANGAPKLCPEFKKRVFRDLKEYLRNVTFIDVDGKRFLFYGDEDHLPDDGQHLPHDGPPRYSIINFRRGPEGRFNWYNVGTYHKGFFNEWERDFEDNFSNDTTIVRCVREVCKIGEVKVQDTEDLCCWHCVQCGEFQSKESEFECKQCDEGYRSDTNRSVCLLIPVTHLDYQHRWAIGAMAFSSVGIAMTLVTGVVLWKYWDTPVVKACGRELSLILLLGTFLSFTTTFAIVATPSPATCGLMRFGIGFCYTVCYSAIVTKTNRVARIFATQRNPRYTSPMACILIACCLVAVEVAINVIWIIVEPPATIEIVGKPPDKRTLVCSGVNDSFMAGLIYPFFLILIATFYAFKTRKSPYGFNETRYIFFASTVSCIHWLAYVPLYLASTDAEIRPIILSFSLTISGMVQLGCMLFPKLYTVLFKPEKNTKVGVMNPHRPSFAGGAETPPNSVALVPRDDHMISLVVPEFARSDSSRRPRTTLNSDLALAAVGVAGRGARAAASSASSSSSSAIHRQLSWIDQSRIKEESLPRRRSSSVCRSTQTAHDAAANAAASAASVGAASGSGAPVRERGCSATQGEGEGERERERSASPSTVSRQRSRKITFTVSEASLSEPEEATPKINGGGGGAVLDQRHLRVKSGLVSAMKYKGESDSEVAEARNQSDGRRGVNHLQTQCR